MATKFKILSAISFISLAIVLTFVGVWALTDLNFIVGGNITYTAPEKPQGYTVTVNYSEMRVVLYKINEMTDFVECEPWVMTFTLEDVYQIEIISVSSHTGEVSTNPNIYSGIIDGTNSTGMIAIKQDTTFIIIETLEGGGGEL